METEALPGNSQFGDDDLLPFDADAGDYLPPLVLGSEEFRYIGQGLTSGEFTDYVRDYDFGTIPPDYIVLHHTAIPSTQAARYPTGGIWDHDDTGSSEVQIKQRRKAALDGIKAVYAARPGWDRGPHLFIDDRYIWLFSPMSDQGIHAMWGNSFHSSNGQFHYSVGIEVVGYYEQVAWPEPVARLVGHAVATLKRRLGTFDLRYLYPKGNPGCVTEDTQMRCAHPDRLVWGGISSHRDYNKPLCPGRAITEAFYTQVIEAAWSQAASAAPLRTTAPALKVAPKPSQPASEATSICAPPLARPEQAAAYICARPHGEYTDHDIASVIVPAYFRICASVGVDPILAIAQMIHETNNLASFWAARPQRNPAGIGVTGMKQADQPANQQNWAFNTQRQQWENGLSFMSWDNDAIPAHVGRLAAYAVSIEAESPTQRDLITRALSYRPLPTKLRGSALVLKQLGQVHNPAGGGWANPGSTYGAQIAAIAQQIAATQA